MQSVPPRGSGWVRSLLLPIDLWLRTHPRGGTDCIQHIFDFGLWTLDFGLMNREAFGHRH